MLISSSLRTTLRFHPRNADAAAGVAVWSSTGKCFELMKKPFVSIRELSLAMLFSTWSERRLSVCPRRNAPVLLAPGFANNTMRKLIGSTEPSGKVTYVHGLKDETSSRGKLSAASQNCRLPLPVRAPDPAIRHIFRSGSTEAVLLGSCRALGVSLALGVGLATRSSHRLSTGND